MTNYPLPSDTIVSLQRFVNRCLNPGLLFERYIPMPYGKQFKQDALKKVQQCQPDRRALDAYRDRWRAMVKAAEATPFEAQTDWRFITGLGRKGPLEVGFTFHRIYGFPIIPGSGLKGLARAWAYFALLEAAPESKPKKDPDFVAVFGREPERGEDEDVASAGGAVFFEAIPLDNPDLELDVMTPHYSKYYGDKSGRIAPTDNQSPNPIPFLTVKPDVRFAFAVGWRGEANPKAHALAVEWLQKGLEKLGAGAKTAAGYGYFILVEAMSSKRPQPPTKATVSSAPPKPEPMLPLTWHTGTVRQYRPDKRRGRLVDDETGEELGFRRDAIEEKGYSPGKKHRVRYAVAKRDGRKVVIKIRRR